MPKLFTNNSLMTPVQGKLYDDDMIDKLKRVKLINNSFNKLLKFLIRLPNR